MTRVLMVCLGNICRSPAAEAALIEAAALAGMDVTVASAGTASWHTGKRPDPRMRAAGDEAGLTIDGAARQVTTQDFRDHDLVVAMDRQNLADLRALAPDADAATRLRLLRDYVGPTDQDVPDPYYGGAEGFADVIDIVREAASSLVTALVEQRA